MTNTWQSAALLSEYCHQFPLSVWPCPPPQVSLLTSGEWTHDGYGDQCPEIQTSWLVCLSQLSLRADLIWAYKVTFTFIVTTFKFFNTWVFVTSAWCLLVTFCDLDVGENQMTFGPNNNIGIESIKDNDGYREPENASSYEMISWAWHADMWRWCLVACQRRDNEWQSANERNYGIIVNTDTALALAVHRLHVSVHSEVAPWPDDWSVPAILASHWSAVVCDRCRSNSWHLSWSPVRTWPSSSLYQSYTTSRHQGS